MDHHLKKLRENGLKLTPRRRAVIELFESRGTRMGPAEVHRELRRTMKTIGVPTVYRILDELEAIGVLIRMRVEDGRLYYALCRSTARHHHHFVCSRCQRVEEVEYCSFPALAEHLQERLGCRCHHLTMYIEGVCAACLQQERSTS